VKTTEQDKKRNYSYILPGTPPSNNCFIGRANQWTYRDEKKRWAGIIAALCREKPDKPLRRASVAITYFFPDRRRRDPDNFSGKMLLDGLTSAGVIADDSFANIELSLHAEYDPKRPRTRIDVRELDMPDA